jgi:RimJ/RimL family protein N-acetyltransferase
MTRSRYPKAVILKDHREVVLRLLAPDDADDLIRFYSEQDLSFRWYMREDPCDPAVVQKWIRAQQEGRAFSILATHEDRIVAHASLLMRTFGAQKRNGRIMIQVIPEFRSVQLGTWLIFDLIKRAMESGLERLRIDFTVGVDDRAIEALRRLDFVKEGRLRDYVIDENGEYRDYVIMVKQLHRGWSDF